MMQKTIYAILILSQRFSRHHPKLVLCLTLFVTIFFLLGIPKLQFLLSIDDLIDPDFKTYQGLNTVNEKFKDKNTVLVSIESKEIFTKSFICDLQKWILETADARNDLIQIQSTFGIRKARIDRSNLSFKSFLDLDCLSADSETQKLKEAFEKIKNSPWHGILTTLDNYSLTVNFVIYDLEDKKFGSIDTTVVRQLQNSFTAKFPQIPYDVYWGGVTTYQSFLKEAMDLTQALNMLMFVLSLLVFRAFLGSWTSGIIFNVTVMTSMIWSYGFMAYAGYPIDVLTNSAGLILSVATLEDFIFIAFGMMRFKWSLKKSLLHFIVPSFFTSLTTAVGFASLGAAELGIIRRIGYVSAFGGLLEWAMVFLVLPAALELWPRLKNLKVTKPWIRIRNPFHKILTKPQTWFAILAVASTVFLWGRIQVKDSPEAFFYESHYVNKTTKHLGETRGWVNEASLLFEQSNDDDTNKQIIEKVKALPLVFKVENPYDIKRFIAEDVENADKSLVQRFWEDSWFAKRLVSSDGTLRAQVFLKNMEAVDIQNFVNQTKNICNGRCEVVGTLISYNEFGDKVLNTLFKSLGISLVMVSMVMIFLRKPLGYYEILACILSSLWGSFALLGIFVIFNIPIYFVSSACAAVLVGLAGDNAIHFIFSAKKRKNQLDSSIVDLEDASLIVTLSMCVLVTVFCLSPIAPFAKLGGLMLVGFLLGYLGDIWVLKGMLRK